VTTQAIDHEKVAINGHGRRAREGDTLGTKWPRLFARLAARFTADEERQMTKGKGPNAKLIKFVTARTIMNRLDEVVGSENWWDDYTPMEHSVVCRLTIRLPDGELLTKVDAGGYAGMSDEGDDDKSGFSDAFKRAAVKFGAGRYLYGEGVAPYVKSELEARREERRASKGEQPGPSPETEDRPEGKPESKPQRREAKATPETSTRDEVNQAFPSGSPEGPERQPTASKGARVDRETTKLWGDRIGARGLDTRPWLDVEVAAVAAARTAIYRFRVDQLGLLPLSDDTRPNDYSVLNHMVKVTVEAGAPDPYPRADPKTGKRKVIGNGRKVEHLHQLYMKSQWREWLRAELASYLRKEVRQARIDARGEAGFPPDLDPEPEHNPGPIDPVEVEPGDDPEGSESDREIVYGPGLVEPHRTQGEPPASPETRPEPPSGDPEGDDDDDPEKWASGRE
jgi:hypothetical protein